MSASAANISAWAPKPVPVGIDSRAYPPNITKMPSVTIFPNPNLSARIPPKNGMK